MIPNNHFHAEVSELIDTFNEAEIRSLVETQIFREDIDLVGSTVIDQFEPIYAKYRSVMEECENPDVLNDTHARFMMICDVFLDVIKEKYSIQIEQTWKDNHQNDIPNATAALYNFLVVHHASNVEEALYNYIVSHISDLYAIFEDQKAKKDASTLTNKKIFTADFAILLSNIYDVCAYVYTNCFTTYDDFFNCINPDDIYMIAVRDLINQDAAVGVTDMNEEILHEVTFLDRLNEIFIDNVSYRGVICLKVADRIKRFASSLEKSDIDAE